MICQACWGNPQAEPGRVALIKRPTLDSLCWKPSSAAYLLCDTGQALSISAFSLPLYSKEDGPDVIWQKALRSAPATCSVLSDLLIGLTPGCLSKRHACLLPQTLNFVRGAVLCCGGCDKAAGRPEHSWVINGQAAYTQRSKPKLEGGAF